MKCNRCNAEIRCTVQFCKQCGAKQNVQKNLIASALENDQEAYTELYRQAEHKVTLTVYSILNPDGGNNADADDVILESMIKGFKSLGQLNNPDSYIAWMQTIARNKSVDYLRKNKNLNFSDLSTDEYDFEDTLVDPDESKRPDLVMDNNAKASLLRGILSEIPQEQRLVLVMYYYHNMKIAEIASELGCTEATVKSRLKYGKSKVETGVNKIEKHHGIKLYSTAPVLLLYWLFRDSETVFACENKMLQNVLMQCKAGTASSANSTAGAESTSKIFAKAGSKGIRIKMAVVVSAIAIVGGAGAIAYHYSAQEVVQSKVTDEEKALYSPILDLYKNGIESDDVFTYTWVNGLTSLIDPEYGVELGYAYADLNADGVSELLIGTNQTYGLESEYAIFDIYSITDGEVKQITRSYLDEYYILCEDSHLQYVVFAEDGSHQYTYYQMDSNGELGFQEQVEKKITGYFAIKDAEAYENYEWVEVDKTYEEQFLKKYEPLKIEFTSF